MTSLGQRRRAAASVRIAMTVARAGSFVGSVFSTASETALDTDEPRIVYKEKVGKVNSDLTVGSDVTSATKLQAHKGISSNGVLLAGRGFILGPAEMAFVKTWKRLGLESHIKDYVNGRDLIVGAWRRKILDFSRLSPDELRWKFPEAYQHLWETVKVERDLGSGPIKLLADVTIA